MRSRRRPSPTRDRLDPAATRIQDLELRVRILEAKVRELRAELKVASVKGEARTAAARTVSAARPRPRCPGCTLELPPGRKREDCVWCGFRFDAVGCRTL
jgi:outer membrane murein-binding lipoprotein Lpp